MIVLQSTGTYLHVQKPCLTRPSFLLIEKRPRGEEGYRGGKKQVVSWAR